MCEGSPEVRATEGPASPAGDTQQRVDDAFGRAFDELAECAAELREHVCLHPLHVDVSAEFLEAARRFALAADAYGAASASVDELASALTGASGIVVASATDQSYLAGFRAGAHAQHALADRFVRGRGWVKVASALMLVPVLDAPEIPTTNAGGSHVPA